MNRTDWRRTPVDELGLSSRAYGCLRRAGVETVGQALDVPECDLLIPDLYGRQTVAEVRKAVSEFVAAQKEVDHADRK